MTKQKRAFFCGIVISYTGSIVIVDDPGREKAAGGSVCLGTKDKRD